jgi:hypothetical protein
MSSKCRVGFSELATKIVIDDGSVISCFIDFHNIGGNFLVVEFSLGTAWIKHGLSVIDSSVGLEYSRGAFGKLWIILDTIDSFVKLKLHLDGKFFGIGESRMCKMEMADGDSVETFP